MWSCTFSRRQARLHDARCRRRLQQADARFLHGAGARHPRRLAAAARDCARLRESKCILTAYRIVMPGLDPRLSGLNLADAAEGRLSYSPSEVLWWLMESNFGQLLQRIGMTLKTLRKSGWPQIVLVYGMAKGGGSPDGEAACHRQKLEMKRRISSGEPAGLLGYLTRSLSHGARSRLGTRTARQ